MDSIDEIKPLLILVVDWADEAVKSFVGSEREEKRRWKERKRR